MKHFLVHDSQDNVGVAVVDIKAGESAEGTTLNRGAALIITAQEAIPLGHKIALRDFRPVADPAERDRVCGFGGSRSSQQQQCTRHPRTNHCLLNLWVLH